MLKQEYRNEGEGGGCERVEGKKSCSGTKENSNVVGGCNYRHLRRFMRFLSHCNSSNV